MSYSYHVVRAYEIRGDITVIPIDEILYISERRKYAVHVLREYASAGDTCLELRRYGWYTHRPKPYIYTQQEIDEM